MKKLLFIINPKAGLQKRNNHIDAILDIFHKADYQIETHYTKGRKDATKIIRQYATGANLIVCMGGDGTLNEVIEGMMEGRLKTPLGYIPAGSTNDFASSLGFSKNPLEQAEFIVTGRARFLDIGCFNGRYFVYTASAGIFVKASYATSQKLKNRFGHMAYIISGIKEFFRMKKMKLRVELDGEVTEGHYVFVAINNATRVGGVLKLEAGNVKFNDGFFELMLIRFPKNVIHFFKIINKVFRQDFTGEIFLKHVQTVKITDCTNIDWSLDGEEEKGQKIISFSVIENAIQFIY